MEPKVLAQPITSARLVGVILGFLRTAPVLRRDSTAAPWLGRDIWQRPSAAVESHDVSRRSSHSRATRPSDEPETPGHSVLCASFATRGPRVQIPSAPQQTSLPVDGERLQWPWLVAAAETSRTRSDASECRYARPPMSTSHPTKELDDAPESFTDFLCSFGFA